MQQTTRTIGLGGMLAVALLAHAQAAQPDKPPPAPAGNLVPNPGMEQVDAKQMPARWSGKGVVDTQVRYRGKRSLRLTQKGKGGAGFQSDTFAPEPNRTYRFSARVLMDGFGSRQWEDKKAGAAGSIEWLDAKGKRVGASGLHMPYGGRVGWCLGEAVAHSPAKAVKACVRFTVGTQLATTTATIWVDDVIVAPYMSTPPGDPVYTYPCIMANPRSTCEIVTDPDAGGELKFDIAKARHVVVKSKGKPGKVLHSKKGKHKRGGVFGRHNIGPPPSKPGRYRAVFYMKVGDNTIDEPVVSLAVNSLGGLLNYHVNARTVRGTEFKQAKRYQGFEVLFVRAPGGPVQYIISWKGNVDMWFDRMDVVTEKVFTDQDMAAYWPMAGPDPALRRKPRGRSVLIVHGLFTELWRLDEAIGNLSLRGIGRQVTRHWLASSWAGWKLKPAFPNTTAALWPYAAVILSNVGALPLGVDGRKALADYVTLGGTLVVLGGPHTLGGGNLAGSFLAPVLPVELTKDKDIVKLDGAVIEPRGDFTPASGLGWEQKPRVYYLHNVRGKPGAEVCMTAGGRPVLVAWKHGRGKVAVLAVTVLGKSTRKGDIEFWNWPYWNLLMERTIGWLVRW